MNINLKLVIKKSEDMDVALNLNHLLKIPNRLSRKNGTLQKLKGLAYF